MALVDEAIAATGERSARIFRRFRIDGIQQREIAAALAAEVAKIDTLITHTQEAIALLKELRAATIADAVLGRVDVRQ